MGKKISGAIKKVSPLGMLTGNNVLAGASGIAGMLGGSKGGGLSGPEAQFYDTRGIAKKVTDRLEGQMNVADERRLNVAAFRKPIIQQLGQTAMGKGPSLAQAQLKAAQDRNLSQQLAAIAGQRGGSAAANQRAFLLGSGQANRATAQDSAIARMQEAQQARQELMQEQQAADALTSQYIKDAYDAELRPYDMLQQYDKERRNVEAANKADRDAKKGSFLSGLAQSGLPTQLFSSLGLGGAAGAGGTVAAGGAAAGAAGAGGLAAGLGSALPFLLMSDKDTKQNIKSNPKDLKKFLASMKPYEYNYKGDKEKRAGIMAQDLEKSKLGKDMVTDVAGIKAVDIKKGISTVLAAQAYLNDELEKLKSKKKKA